MNRIPPAMLGAVDDVVIAGSNAVRGAEKGSDPLKKAAEKAHHKHRKQKDVDSTAPTPEQLAEYEKVARETQKVPAIDKAIGVTNTALSVGGFVPFVAPVAGWVGDKVAAGGERFAPKLGFIQSIGKGIGWPARFLKQTFSELGGKMGGFGKAIGRGTQAVFDGAAPVTQFISDKSGLSNWQRRRHFGKAAIAHEKAMELAKTLDLSTAPQAVSEHLRDLHNAVHLPSGVNHEAAAAASTAIEKALVDKAVTAEHLKPFQKFITAAEDAAIHSKGAASWKNIGQAVKNAPAALAKAPIGHTVMNGSFIAMSGMSMVADTRSAAKDLASLKQMLADATGKDVKDISTVKALFGAAPEPVRAARSHLMKNYSLKQLADVGNVALQVMMVVSKRFGMMKSMLAFGGVTAFSKVTDAVMGESTLPVFQAFRDEFMKNKGVVPADYYAAFAGAMVPELRSRGGMESKFAQALGEQLAAEKATPAQMLKELDNGAMSARINKIIVASEEAAKTAPAATAAAAPAKGEVIGKHTGMLQQQAATQATQQGAGRV